MIKQRLRKIWWLTYRLTASNVRAWETNQVHLAPKPTLIPSHPHTGVWCVRVCMCGLCIQVCVISQKSLEDCLLAPFPPLSLPPSLFPSVPLSSFLFSLSPLDDIRGCLCSWHAFFPGLRGSEMLAFVSLQPQDTQHLEPYLRKRDVVL